MLVLVLLFFLFSFNALAMSEGSNGSFLIHTMKDKKGLHISYGGPEVWTPPHPIDLFERFEESDSSVECYTCDPLGLLFIQKPLDTRIKKPEAWIVTNCGLSYTIRLLNLEL